MSETRDTVVDVVVVGGGISGLAATDFLRSAASDLSVVVLEASARLGGRILTDEEGTELGAAFFGPGQHRMLRLIEGLGLAMYDVDVGGKTVLELKRGEKLSFARLIPDHNWFVRLDVNAACRRIDRDAHEIAVDSPAQHTNAKELDGMRLDDYLKQICWTEAGYEYLRLQLSTDMASESSDLSALAALWFVHSVGDLSTMLVGESWKVKGGNSQLIAGLASRIGTQCIRTNHAVQTIDFSQPEGIVVCGESFKVIANRVVIAVPPTQIQRIKFSPALPALRQQELQRCPMGRVIKTFTYYSARYWKEAKFSGRALACGPQTCANDVFDDSNPMSTEGCILGFVNGDRASEMLALTPEERMLLLGRQYADLFSAPTLAQPTRYKEKCWADEPWIGGCYFGCPARGVLSTFGRGWRLPLGDKRIFFAGTEAANEWMGYMEGGVEAAEQVARAVVTSLGRDASSVPASPPRARGPNVTNPSLPQPGTVVMAGCAAVVLGAVALVAWKAR
jgi:monoamine oxidase